MRDHQLERVVEEFQKVSGARSVMPVAREFFNQIFLASDPLAGFGNVPACLNQMSSLHFLVHGLLASAATVGVCGRS